MKQISYLPEKEFKVIVTKLLTKLRSTDEHRANFKKGIEKKRKYQTEVTEQKKILQADLKTTLH